MFYLKKVSTGEVITEEDIEVIEKIKREVKRFI